VNKNATIELPAPWGCLLAEWERRGVRRVTFLRRRPRRCRPGFPQDVAGALTRYLRGEPANPAELPAVLDGTPFQMAVWREARRIPYGRTVTYGELARRLGKPGAARAVGLALGANQVPLIVPCHRVVAAGGLGGFASGEGLKEELLRLEGAGVY